MQAGDLADGPLADILRTLAAANATGGLHIRRREEGDTAPADFETADAVLFLREGRLYAASAPGPRPLLGVRLVAAGAVTREALEEALESQAGELAGWRLGELLVHLGYVDADIVAEFVVEQILDTVAEVSAWPAGGWRFRRGEKTREPDGLLLDIEDVLGQVHVRRLSWRDLEATAGGATAVPVRISFDEVLAARQIPLARTLLEEVDGRRTLAELGTRCGLTTYEAGYVLSHLVESGAVVLQGLEAPAPAAPPAPADDDLSALFGGADEVDLGTQLAVLARQAEEARWAAEARQHEEIAARRRHPEGLPAYDGELDGGLTAADLAALDGLTDERGAPVDHALVDHTPVDIAPLVAPLVAPLDQAPVDEAPVEVAPVEVAPLDVVALEVAPLDTRPPAVASLDDEPQGVPALAPEPDEAPEAVAVVPLVPDTAVPLVEEIAVEPAAEWPVLAVVPDSPETAPDEAWAPEAYEVADPDSRAAALAELREQPAGPAPTQPPPGHDLPEQRVRSAGIGDPAEFVPTIPPADDRAAIHAALAEVAAGSFDGPVAEAVPEPLTEPEAWPPAAAPTGTDYAPGADDLGPVADTAALLRELSSLGLDDPPVAAPASPRPPAPRTAPAPAAGKPKRKSIFGR